MSQPVPLTVKCFAWFPIHITGIYNYDTSEWTLPEGLRDWALKHFRGQWAESRPSERTMFLIQDKRDAMLFRTVWFDNLHENADG